MNVRPDWDGVKIDRDALMNAIWNRYPEYAFANNIAIQSGMRENAISAVLKMNYKISDERKDDLTIWLNPDVGDDFLIWGSHDYD